MGVRKIRILVDLVGVVGGDASLGRKGELSDDVMNSGLRLLLSFLFIALLRSRSFLLFLLFILSCIK